MAERERKSVGGSGDRAGRSRVWVRLCRWLTVVVLLVLVSALVVMRSGVLGQMVLPRVSSALGVRVEASSVKMSLGGVVVIEDLVVTTEDVSGVAGRLLSSPRARVELGWPPSANTLRRVVLERPTVRVSQGADFSLNLSSLLRVRERSGGLDRLPNIEIIEGILELGEHDGGAYTPLASLVVHGEMTETSRGSGVHRLELQEVNGPDGTVGMYVAGEADLVNQRAWAKIRDVDLGEWAGRRAPKAFRDVWERLSMRGQVTEAEIRFAPEDGVSARVTLDEVDLNIPFPRAKEIDAQTGLATAWTTGQLPMRGVTGSLELSGKGVRADLGGMISDLRTRVTLTATGLTMQAPLRITIDTPGFELADEPRLLPYAPDFVRKILRRFSGPTAELAGSMLIVRDGAGVWSYSGAYRLENGRARFEGFPYPVENIHAQFEFDERAVRILHLIGRGPTGANLLANGVISPPGDGARVEIDITVSDLPMDEHFREALPDDRRAAYEVLFNETALDAFLGAGLLISPDMRAELEREREGVVRALSVAESGEDERVLRMTLGEIDRMLEIPVFELGGRATLDVRVLREAGENQRYRSEIDFRLDEADVIPRGLAYPLRAEGVRLRITDSYVEVSPVSLRGITGGEGVISGEVELLDGGGFRPVLELRAVGVPVDGYLLGSLPGGLAWGADGEAGVFGGGALGGGFSPSGMLEGLGLTGVVSCDARITGREPEGLDLEAVVDLGGVSSRPGDELLRLDDLRGSIVITEDYLEMEGVRGRLGESAIEASVRAELGAGGGISGLIRVDSFDLSSPIEELVETVSEDVAARLGGVRDTYRPSGIVDGVISFASSGGSLDATVALERGEWMEFDALGARVRLTDLAGGMTVGRERAMLDGFGALMRYGDDAPVRMGADGSLALESGGVGGVEVWVEGMALESGAAGALTGVVSDAARETLRVLELRGVVDARASLVQSGDGRTGVSKWRIEPRNLSLVREGVRLEFGAVSGGFAWEDGTGLLENLALDAGEWAVGLDGVWFAPPRVGLDASFTASGESFPREAMALLPSAVFEVLEGVELGFDGAFEALPAHLSLRLDEQGGVDELAFDGTMRFEGARVRAGVALTEIAGRAELMVRSGAGRAMTLDTTIVLDSLRAAGVRLTDGEVRLISGERGGSLIVPRFEASVHGGRVSGRGGYAAGERAGDVGRTELHMQLVDVGFGGVLSELGGGGEVDPIPDRGLLGGNLTWSEEAGSRRGRGTFRVEGGDVLNQPGVVPLLRLSNLQAPAGEKVDLAFVEFFVVGDRLIVETMTLFSPSLKISAEGVVVLPSLSLDMRVASSGTRHLPVLSDLFERFRDELVTARVTGTIEEPEFRLEQFSGARRLLETMIGRDADARRSRE